MRRWLVGVLMIAVAVLVVGPVTTSAAADPQVEFARAPSGLIADAVFDESRDLVYAAYRSNSPSRANRIVAFDPVTGAAQWSTGVGEDPRVLALSDDASVLYVGLHGSNEVARIRIEDRVKDLTFSLGSDVFGNGYRAQAISVLPGQPNSVIVARERFPHGGHLDIQVFDEGVARPVSAQGRADNAFHLASATHGFVLNTSGLTVLAIDEQGLSLTDEWGDHTMRGDELVEFDGRLYGRGGEVVDAMTGDKLATLPFGLLAIPTEIGRVAYSLDSRNSQIQMVDLDTFSVIGSPVPVVLPRGPVEGAIATTDRVLIWGYDEIAERDTGSAPVALEAPVSDAVYDDARELIYALTPATFDGHANSVIAIDAADESVVWSAWVGSDPNDLALSEDGKKLYVGLLGGSRLVRVDIPTRTVELDFALPRIEGNPTHVSDVEFLPGTNETAVVSLKFQRGSPSWAGVAVFDDDVQRPNLGHEHMDVPVIIAVDADRFYGWNIHSTSDSYITLEIDADGISSSYSGLSMPAKSDGLVHEGRLYAADGRIRIPSTLQTKKRLPLSDLGVAVPHVRNGEVHLTQGSRAREIVSYDIVTYEQTREPFQVISPPGSHIVGLVSTDHGFFVWTEDAFGMAEQPPPTGIIEGRATDEVTGGGIETLCVTAVGSEGDFSTTTDDDGEYVLEIPMGNYLVLFHDCEFFGYFAEWFDDQLPFAIEDATEVEVTRASTHRVDAEIDRVFYDLEPGTTFVADIFWIRNAGITTGCSQHYFCPKESVTREQMAAFVGRLWRLLGGECPDGEMPFVDVAVGSFAYDDIICIFELGITTGTTPTRYSPKEPVSREQMAAFIARLWRALGGDCPTGRHPFVDVRVTSFASVDIACIFQLGITTGTSADRYDPHAIVTREQMAAFLARTGREVPG